jgi:hypothetical protein
LSTRSVRRRRELYWKSSGKINIVLERKRKGFQRKPKKKIDKPGKSEGLKRPPEGQGFFGTFQEVPNGTMGCSLG